MDELSATVRAHLSSTYAHVAGMMGAAAVGSIAGFWYTVPGRIMGFLLPAILIVLVSLDKKSLMRVPLLLGFGFLKGLSVAPVLWIAMSVDPSLILTSFLATSVIFVTFSVAALNAEKRLLYYLSSVLMACTLLLLGCLTLLYFDLGSRWVFNIYLYVGLVIFMLCVISDTKTVIAEAEAGTGDPVHHAVRIFTDFIDIFVQILIILVLSSLEKKD